jgi:hypothetical protein
MTSPNLGISSTTIYTSPVAEYTTLASFNAATSLTDSFLQTLTSFEIVKDGAQTDSPLFLSYNIQNTFLQKDFTDIATQLKSSLQQYSDVASTISTHEGFTNYMKAIMTAICKWRYSTIINGLKTNSSSISPEFKPAVNLLSSISDTIIIDITNLCMKSIQSRAEREPVNSFIGTLFDKGASMEASQLSLRYKIRQDMLVGFNLKLDNAPDANTLINLKHILLDTYIVSMYPYIHWMYITALLDKYKKAGNFNLMREAVFARATCTMFALVSLYEKAQPLSDGSTDFNTSLTSVSTYISNIYTYIQNLTNVQFGNDNYGWSDVLNEVKKVSSGVTNKSMTIQQLKEQLRKVQLQVRADIDTYKSINGAYEWKIIQYKLLVVFLIFLIMIAGVLLTMNMETRYVMYSISSILAIFLLVKVIQAITWLMK